jgi:hypothetical protein
MRLGWVDAVVGLCCLAVLAAAGYRFSSRSEVLVPTT